MYRPALESWARQQRAMLMGELIGDSLLWIARIIKRLIGRSS